jgi:type I restriction enzyme S subunit
VTMGQMRWPVSWRSAPLWSLFERVKDVGHPEETMLSVYREHGVVPKGSRDDNFNKTAENRNIYQLVHPGWLVVNRMKAWQGSVGISSHRGIVSGHYICFRPSHGENPKFLNYLLRSGVYTAELRQLSRGVRPHQVEIDNDWLRVLPIHLPPLPTQRAIADYLDRETARIDALIVKKQRLVASLEERFESAVFQAVTRGLTSGVPLRPSGLSWVEDIPAHWGTPAVSVHFDLQLGKMLNAEAATGPEQFPYLRNVNGKRSGVREAWGRYPWPVGE